MGKLLRLGTKVGACICIVCFFSCEKPSPNVLDESFEDYNILWLVAEDMSPYIPPFGDSTVQTPNLSRLAKEGVRYTNLYAPSGVCSPSRYAIITGRYPSADGAHNMRVSGSTELLSSVGLKPYEVVPPSNVKMLSEVLREEGYYCSNNVKQDYQFEPTVTAWDESSQQAHWRKRADDQPFFSIFNFVITHESQFFGLPSPMSWRYFKDFPNDTTAYPWGKQIDSSEWKLNPMLRMPTVPPYLPDNEVVRKDMATMYSNIVYMDQQVGVILDQLEKDGLLDKTIIVWYADHGGPLPRQKRLVYDSGLKTPMIIRYPNQKDASKVDDQLISFIDLAPTFLSLVGIEPGSFYHGMPFAGSFKPEEERKYIHAAADRFDGHYDRIRAVKDKRFKYIKNFNPEKPYYLPIAYREKINTMKELLRLRDEGSLNDVQMQWFRSEKPKEELFDTWEDPHELNNLAGDENYHDKLVELREECNRWIDSINDKGNIPEKELALSFWPDWKAPKTESPKITKVNGMVSIDCSTQDASIGYQVLSGDNRLTETWQPYTRPFELNGEDRVVAVADRIGWEPSELNYSK